MSDEVFLPGAGSAEVPEEKLHGYALSLDHPTGRHKARVFLSVLGIGHDDWSYLRDQILERVVSSPGTALRPKPPFEAEMYGAAHASMPDHRRGPRIRRV